MNIICPYCGSNITELEYIHTENITLTVLSLKCKSCKREFKIEEVRK